MNMMNSRVTHSKITEIGSKICYLWFITCRYHFYAEDTCTKTFAVNSAGLLISIISIAIASIGDTFIVSLSVSAILLSQTIAIAIADTFESKYRYRLSQYFHRVSLTTGVSVTLKLGDKGRSRRTEITHHVRGLLTFD